MKDRFKTLLIGIGNPNMGDDAIGLLVANEIKKQELNIDTEVLYYISFEILDKIIGYDKVIIVDAADIGLQLGDIDLLTYSDIKGSEYLHNSHGLNLYQVIKVGYEVFNSNMPKNIYLLLIQTGKINSFKRGINRKLKENVPHIIERIKSVIGLKSLLPKEEIKCGTKLR